MPSGDNKFIDLGMVFYADVELRNEASILLGKGPYAAAFRVKKIMEYFDFTSFFSFFPENR